MKLRTILGSLVVFCAVVAISFAADAANANLGTWKLVEAKSKFSPERRRTTPSSTPPRATIGSSWSTASTRTASPSTTCGWAGSTGWTIR